MKYHFYSFCYLSKTIKDESITTHFEHFSKNNKLNGDIFLFIGENELTNDVFRT